MLTFFWTNKTGCQTMVIHIKVHTECSGFWHLVVLEIEIVIFKCQGHIIRDTFLLLWCNRESKVTHTLFPENFNQFEVTRDLKEGRCPNFLDLTFAPAVIFFLFLVADLQFWSLHCSWYHGVEGGVCIRKQEVAQFLPTIQFVGQL